MPSRNQPNKSPLKTVSAAPKPTWQRAQNQKPYNTPSRHTHMSFGLGKHRKSFGHV